MASIFLSPRKWNVNYKETPVGSHKNSQHLKSWWYLVLTSMWNNWNSHTFLYETTAISVQPRWKTLQQFLVKVNILLPHDPAVLVLGIYPREIKHLPIEYLYMNVYKIIHRKNLKIMQISNKREMKNQIMAYLYNVIIIV